MYARNLFNFNVHSNFCRLPRDDYSAEYHPGIGWLRILSPTNAQSLRKMQFLIYYRRPAEWYQGMLSRVAELAPNLTQIHLASEAICTDPTECEQCEFNRMDNFHSKTQGVLINCNSAVGYSIGGLASFAPSLKAFKHLARVVVADPFKRDFILFQLAYRFQTTVIGINPINFRFCWDSILSNKMVSYSRSTNWRILRNLHAIVDSMAEECYRFVPVSPKIVGAYAWFPSPLVERAEVHMQDVERLERLDEAHPRANLQPII
ncbi:hypothetical protein B0T17DRAFT_505879 [Bombardia bombarda]|uniref:Uncharacterized protein n=1 Tax=Bombardia bombarda TaxID=252184 RepID=A0AA40C9M2_9PEZI|nr:hypothetical protein B0T17DRAFT_505879 [Bombardia bombarda]